MKTVMVDTMTIAYRELGAGPAVLLLHGWPTSSYLWREVMPAIARRNRVVAVDLPGFGASAKPLDRHYGFATFSSVIDGLLQDLGIDKVALGGHDLGGPIAVRWAMQWPDRVTGLALLNTLLYPDLDPAVVEFVTALLTPGPREKLTSSDGLADLIRAGMADPAHATEEMIAAVVAPFQDDDARLALAKAGSELSLRTLAEVAAGLPSLSVPVRVVYGTQDRILPDVEATMARLQGDVPHATATPLPQCGHFLHEEAPDQIGEILAEFYGTLGDY
jgi:pimeloyl-ACP methyl ester carboxylesterase